MQLIELSHNDDVISIANKCNINFKNIWFTLKNMTNKQVRYERSETDSVINSVVDNLITTTIPNVVTSQIAAQNIPGQISNAIEQEDIPQMVADEVSQRMPDAYPEIGTYVISANMPSYSGTAWQQADTITTDSSVTIPVWERIS